MIQWFKGWCRTRKALRNLKREIDVERIKLGAHPDYTTEQLARMEHGSGLDQIAGLKPPPEQMRLFNLCKRYLIIKRIGVDAAVLHKLEGAA